jgi:hypothetical protein
VDPGAPDHDPEFAGVTEFAYLEGAFHTWEFGNLRGFLMENGDLIERSA